MQPKTSRQKEVMSLSRKLPPLSKQQEDRIKKRIKFPTVFTYKRNEDRSVVCGNCDNRFILHRDYKKKNYTCPHCNHKIKVKDMKRMDSCSIYCGVTEYVGDYQVLRYYILTKKYYRYKPSELSLSDEAYQLWFNVKDSKVTIVARSVFGNVYYDKWNFFSPMEIKVSYNLNMSRYFSELRYWLYPYRLHPALRKRGLRGFLKISKSPTDIMESLMRRSAVETLIKAKEYDVLSELSFEDIGRLWGQIKLLLRKGYQVRKGDWKIWADMVDNLKDLGKDIHSPKWICPSDLYIMHDWTLEKKRRQRKKEELEENIRLYGDKYEEKKGKYFGVLICTDEFDIRPLQTIAEFYEEGEAMGHCVYTNKYYADDDNLCLSCRDKEGNRIETVEVSLKELKVLQSRARFNGVSEFHDKILEAVNANMQQFRL